MQLLEPGFRPADAPATVVGRIRTDGDPDIEAGVDAALAAAEFEIVDLEWDLFAPGGEAFAPIYFAEMWEVDHVLVETNPEDVGQDIAQTVATADIFRGGVEDARRTVETWRDALADLFGRVQVFALPTLPMFPPRLDALDDDSLFPIVIELTKHVALFNAAGLPCTAQPVPVPGRRLPASLQLVGPMNGEELLVTTAATG